MFDIFYFDKPPQISVPATKVCSFEQAMLLSRTRFFWIANYLCVYDQWQWNWEPPPWQCHQRHAWKSRWHPDSGTYLVPKCGFHDTNYHSQVLDSTCDMSRWSNLVNNFDYTWLPDYREPPMIYQFGTQWQKTGGPTYHVPGAKEIKYVKEPRYQKTTIDDNWHCQVPRSSIKDFDWTWHPDATEPPFIYVFGSQHQKTSGIQYHVPGAVEHKYVENIKLQVKDSQASVALIDFLDGNVDKVKQQLLCKVPLLKVTKYMGSYLETLLRLSKQLTCEWAWVCSSVCDYSDFDFTWHPEQWQASMLHVFASDGNKFGDTFFMHVPTFSQRAQRVSLLEWYDINFVDTSVPRFNLPVVRHQYDSHVDAIKLHDTAAPITMFVCESTPDFDSPIPSMNLWRSETKTVIPLDAGGCRVLMPREAILDIKTQVYDYAHIDKSHTSDNACYPLDIVFISNRESNADQNWGALLHSKQGSPNRCVRVDGVNGRAAAYHAAAEASETPWFFAVFAKLEVIDNFDWSWQPDRLQQPKHYIFHALNPVNMLEYGHQAMIAYNKKLVLANPGRGLDFTLDDAHEVVPILSGVARYNVDPWTAWRTAFREALKLKASLPDIENQYRLDQWLTRGSGPYGEYSVYGAEDALAYYNEVDGKFEDLKKSYEWTWLASYALVRRNLVPDH